MSQSDRGAEIHVAPHTIAFAFIVLTNRDRRFQSTASDLIADLNEHVQPKVWRRQIRARFVTLAASAGTNGFPDVRVVGPALERLGLTAPYSLVVNTMTVSFDGGGSQSRILVGFSFVEAQTRLILPRDGGCVAR